MSVLQTFYLMFEADTKKVSDGLADIDKQTKGVTDGAATADRAVNKLGDSFVRVAKAGAAMLAAAFSVGAIKTAINATAELTGQIEAQARALNVSTESLTTWQNVLIKIGGSASEANATIGGLMSKLRTMNVEGGQSLAMMQMGLSAADVNDPLKVMTKLADTFSALNKNQQLYLGEKLGLDANTIELLGRGREHITDLIAKQQQLGVVTKAQAEIAAAYREQLDNVSQLWETIRREITTAVLPTLTWLLDKIQQVITFFRQNEAFAKGFFGAMAAVLTGLLIPALVRGTLATVAFLGPWLLIGAAIAAVISAIGLVVDDIDNFMRGNNSLIGEISKKWPIVGDVVTVVANLFVASLNLMGVAMDKAKAIISANVDSILAILTFFYELVTKGPEQAFTNFVDRMKGIFNELKKEFQWYGEAAAVVGDLFTKPVETMGKVWDKTTLAVKNFFDTVRNGPRALVGALGNMLGVDLLQKWENEGDKMPSHAPLTGSMGEKGAIIAGKLQAMGWTPEQAAGIAGSFLQESSGDHTAVNKSSGATGVGQWLGSRKADFAEWAGKPLEQSSLDEQLRFFQHEVTAGKERRAGNMLRATTTSADAARVHSQFYERPGKDEAHIEKRQRYADQILAAQRTMERTSQFAAASGAAVQATTTNNNARALTVQTGPISVQSSDPKAAADEMAKALRRQFTNARDTFDDGVAG